jgi:[ribosomal protein S18]-alanine N-acetyltransferase
MLRILWISSVFLAQMAKESAFGVKKLMNPVAMIENLFSRKVEFDLFSIGSADCRDMSVLHGERFYRGWGDGEFHSLLTQSNVFGYTTRMISQPTRALGGFVLVREAAGEAEILTIAVSEKYPRIGLGWRLLQAAIRETHARGGETMFLEVDEGNHAAIGLYRKHGFRKTAERKGYYDDGKGNKSTALVMQRDLR